MSTGRADRGTTLLEMLICSALFLLLLGYVWQMMVSSQRYTENIEAKSQLEKSILSATQAISRHLVESDRYTVSVGANPGVLLFASPRNAEEQVTFDAQGRMLWCRFECYYVGSQNNTSVLMRKLQYLATPSPEPPPAPLIANVLNDPNTAASVVSQNISTFTPSALADGSVVLTLRGDLKLTRHSYGLEINDKILPSN